MAAIYNLTSGGVIEFVRITHLQQYYHTNDNNTQLLKVRIFEGTRIECVSNGLHIV